MGKPQRPLGPRQLAGGGQPASRRIDVLAVIGGGMVVEIVRDAIGRGVMQGRDEKRVPGDFDAVGQEARPHFGVVQQRRQQAAIHLARIASASAAMQRARVRIVDDVGAVPHQQHEPRKATGQRHGPEHGRGHAHAGREIGGGRELGRRVVRGRRAMQPQRIGDELAGIDGPGRLDEGERGHRGQLEAPPRPPGPRPYPDGPVGVRGLIRAGAGRERGIEQHRQAQFLDIGPQAPMRRGEAEKAREPRRPDIGSHTLQRPAEDFGTHVDAEGGLQRRPAVAGARGHRRQALRQLTLGGALRGLLQNGVDRKVGSYLDRHRMRLAHLRPPPGDRRLVATEQGLFPDEPDGQEIAQRPVRVPGQLGLPQFVAGILRPPSQRHEQMVEIGARRRVAEAEQAGCARDGGSRGVRRSRYFQRKSRQTRNLRGQVVHRRRAPDGIGTLAARRRPECLTLVEISGRPGSQTFGDKARPVDPGDFCGEIGDRGQRPGTRRIQESRPLQPGQIGGSAVGRRIGPCRQQVLIGNRAAHDLLAVPVPRHGDGDAGDACEACAGRGQALGGLAEEGIDGHAGGERPCRRDRAHGLRHRGLESPDTGLRCVA